MNKRAVAAGPTDVRQAGWVTSGRVALIAWGLVVATILIAAAYILMGLARRQMASTIPPMGWADVLNTLPFVVVSTVGAIIVTKQPRNAVGWVAILAGFSNVVPNFATEYALRAVVVRPGSLPAGKLAVWLMYWSWAPSAFSAPLALLLLPTGRYLSRRWRWAGRATIAMTVITCVATGFGTGYGPNLLGITPAMRNPLRLPAVAAILDYTVLIVLPVLALLTFLGFVSLVLRYRRTGAVERQQLKWIMLAGFGLAVNFVVSAVTSTQNSATLNLITNLLNAATTTAVAVAILLAILKYRLYDIDLVISRTLVYAALAAFITLVYVAIVVGLGSLVGGGGRPNLLLSIVATAVVAVAFQPVRERLQRLANRLVYGNRATPYEVLSQFSTRVAESYAADDVLPRMAHVLADGTGAEAAEVWLRTGNALRRAAAWPPSGDEPGTNGTGPVAVDVRGQLLPALLGADRAAPVRHQGELLGALAVTKRRGESLTPMEDKLLEDLAQQAGLVLRNVGLTSDLRARLEDLRYSRQRLVKAQDDERRRLERNLHDGAQQHLVAIKVKLGLAEALAGKDPERARATLKQLKADTDEALQTLRDLARGIYPPLLAEQGLVPAVEAQAARATLPVNVRADGVARYPQEVEAAVYFCILEALQNVQKYAGASAAEIDLHGGDGSAAFEVRDNGAGFDPEATRRGSGLQNMADRLEALGGTLRVESVPGGGTVVSGRVPATAAV